MYVHVLLNPTVIQKKWKSKLTDEQQDRVAFRTAKADAWRSHTMELRTLHETYHPWAKPQGHKEDFFGIAAVAGMFMLYNWSIGDKGESSSGHIPVVGSGVAGKAPKFFHRRKLAYPKMEGAFYDVVPLGRFRLRHTPHP